MSLLEGALQRLSSQSGGPLTADGIISDGTDGPITPLATQLIAISNANAQAQAIASLAGWVGTHLGSNTNGDGISAIQADLNSQDLINATIVQSAEGIAFQLANGSVYALNSDGSLSILQVTRDASGNLVQTVTNSDGSIIQAVSGTDSAGNQVALSVITRDASGNVIADTERQSNGSYIEVDLSSDGSSTQTHFTLDTNGNRVTDSVVVHDALGDVTSDTELQGDGTYIESQFANGVLTNQNFTDANGDLAETIAFNADSSTLETDFSAPDANGDQIAQSIIARDASGNITDDKELQADGSTIETQFSGGSKTNEIVTDANGDLAKTVAFNPDGSTLEKDFSAPDANGDQVAQSIIARDASGNITDDKELQSDGSTIETQFSNGVESNQIFTDPNGDTTKTIAFNADDSQTISTFDAQGHVTLTQDVNASGILVSAIAHDDAGNVTSDKELQSDGTYIETQFDNGVTTAQIFSDANGTPTKAILFNDDGSTTVKTFNDQGDVSLTENFDPNGNFVSATGTSAAGVAFSQVGQGVGASFTYLLTPLATMVSSSLHER
jgi:uncharacterized protein YjbJ (UPF0337 family)